MAPGAAQGQGSRAHGIKRRKGEISKTHGSTITGSKKIRDGVELRYHSREDFTALDPDKMGGTSLFWTKTGRKRPRTVLVAT